MEGVGNRAAYRARVDILEVYNGGESGRRLTTRYFTEGAFDPIAVVAGLIQTAIYADFGYIVSGFSLLTR